MALGPAKFKVGDRVKHSRSSALPDGVVEVVTQDHPHNHPLETWWYVVRWVCRWQWPDPERRDYSAEQTLELY